MYKIDYYHLPWQFVSSPPGWWAIFKRKEEVMALPIVAWRILPDNRCEKDIQNEPDRSCPHGEPLIMAGDGLLESCFGQGNLTAGVGSPHYDFGDGWMFAYADYIPKTKGRLRAPVGDNIFWEVI